mmetsp:Transcript_42910/g.100198  ORF Transcript_42910/g.100198 Transcript_42910/m.100198 type:complete len:131 (-) Transcript_42910:67-459(-)
MGNLSLRSPTSMPAPAPIFYNKEFLETYGSEAPPQKPAEVPEVPAPVAESPHEMKERERLRVLAEIRNDELSGAEATAERIGRWAEALSKRSVPCLAEQQEVERCYAAPPGGDQLKCSKVVDAYVRCAKA